MADVAMRGVDLHVHLPTEEWLCGCIGPYLPSVEHYFGVRPRPHGVSELREVYESNVYLDMSGWRYRYLPDEVLREMRRRLSRQFCFGTDYPMFEPSACLEELDRLELPDEVAKRVLRDNAASLLGID